MHPSQLSVLLPSGLGGSVVGFSQQAGGLGDLGVRDKTLMRPR